jgi:hypothetical protein
MTIPGRAIKSLAELELRPRKRKKKTNQQHTFRARPNHSSCCGSFTGGDILAAAKKRTGD